MKSIKLCGFQFAQLIVHYLKPPEYFVKYCKQHKVDLVYGHE